MKRLDLYINSIISYILILKEFELDNLPIDYIIVHELCHLKEPIHSAKFWEMVKSLFPNYKKRKEWLGINGPNLDLRF